MRRLTLLISGLVVAAAATLANTAERGKSLRAGAATSNLTPDLGVLLDGSIMQVGPARHIHDELLARCLVLEAGSTRLAFVVCDNTMIATEVADEARRRIRERTGLPPECVLIAATHTHSTPRALELGLGEEHRAYRKFLIARVVDGVQRAINLLAPAEVGWGQGRKPEFLQNRRWFMPEGAVPPDPFGGRTDQVLMGAPVSARTKPAGPVDPEVFVLAVRHRDGRPLAVLANYGLHYIGGVPPGRVSADYFGVFADEVQRLLGADRQDPPFVAMMSNGTSGDVNAIPAKASEAASSPPARAWAYPRMQEVGESVAREVKRVIDGLSYRSDVLLGAADSELQLAVRRPDAARLDWARSTLAGAKDPGRMTRPQVYAREAQHLANYPPVQAVRVQAWRIGDLGVAMIPCEVFAETGLAIKRGSPWAATFTIELANGYHGYLPSPAQHALGGYETWPARSSLLEVEAEPKIRDEVLRLLAALAVGR